MIANGQNNKPTWHKNVAIANLTVPIGVPNGVIDHGTKFHSGPVSMTRMTTSAMPFEIFALAGD